MQLSRRTAPIRRIQPASYVLVLGFTIDQFPLKERGELERLRKSFCKKDGNQSISEIKAEISRIGQGLEDFAKLTSSASEVITKYHLTVETALGLHRKNWSSNSNKVVFASFLNALSDCILNNQVTIVNPRCHHPGK